MRLVNKTQYDTRELRGLACLAYRTLAKVEGAAAWWPRLRITVQYGRSWGVRGYAYLHGGPVTITLPRAGKPLQSWTVQPDGTRTQHREPPPSRKDVLWVLMHELMHCWGYQHNQFGEPVLPTTWPKAGAALTVVPARSKPAVDHVGKRAERAQALLDRWQRRLALAKTKVQVYTRKVTYYEYKRAAGKAPPAAPYSSVS